MVYLSGCPKCHGDVYVDRDRFGAALQCTQCGHVQELTPDRTPPTPPAKIARRLVQLADAVTRSGQPEYVGAGRPSNGRPFRRAA